MMTIFSYDFISILVFAESILLLGLALFSLAQLVVLDQSIKTTLALQENLLNEISQTSLHKESVANDNIKKH